MPADWCARQTLRLMSPCRQTVGCAVHAMSDSTMAIDISCCLTYFVQIPNEDSPEPVSGPSASEIPTEFLTPSSGDFLIASPRSIPACFIFYHRNRRSPSRRTQIGISCRLATTDSFRKTPAPKAPRCRIFRKATKQSLIHCGGGQIKKTTAITLSTAR